MSDALYTKAMNHLQYGEKEKAIKCLEKAVFEGHLESIIELGSIYYERGDVEAASVVYSQGIQQHSCHVCMYNKALILITQLPQRTDLAKDIIVLLLQAYEASVLEEEIEEFQWENP